MDCFDSTRAQEFADETVDFIDINPVASFMSELSIQFFKIITSWLQLRFQVLVKQFKNVMSAMLSACLES